MLNIKKYHKIHCIGIGGVGLSAIAEILISKGFKVSGSDMNSSPIIEKLIENGADIFIGHRAENIKEADLIVYSAAISEENPEMKAAEEKGIPRVGRAEVLGVLMDEYPIGIAVSGTHGKTTTTSMISVILERSKKNPTILVGGKVSELDGNFKVGSGEYFVTEACEYRDSFLSLSPYMEIILNIDSDHLDYFKDIDHIVNSFDRFTKNIKAGGKLIAYDSNPFVKRILESRKDAITYGYSDSSTYSITDISFGSDGMPSFNIMHKDKNLGRVELIIPGDHNILNATAAFACCHQLGVEPKEIISALKEFSGTARRFDVLGINKEGVKVVDDYAHHPNEIKATLHAAENLPHGKIICIFQPHTYTRTLALFDGFADAFEDADVIILADIYAAREKDIYKVNSKALTERIKDRHPDKDVIYSPDFDDMVQIVKKKANAGDIVITMGAGDIYKVGRRLLEG